MLLMSDVSKVYTNGAKALQDVNVHIEPGEFVFVVGPSGAGKSTFIKMLFREELPKWKCLLSLCPMILRLTVSSKKLTALILVPLKNLLLMI